MNDRILVSVLYVIFLSFCRQLLFPGWSKSLSIWLIMCETCFFFCKRQEILALPLPLDLEVLLQDGDSGMLQLHLISDMPITVDELVEGKKKTFIPFSKF